MQTIAATLRPRTPLSPDPGREPDWKIRTAYGIGGVPNLFGNLLIRNLAVPYFHMTLGLSPSVLGLALAVPRIWDAVLDPLVGYLSDHTRTRWGRRRPFIVIGGITGAIAFAAIWWAPVNWNASAQMRWLLGASLVFYTFHNFWSVPFLSLGYELSSDYHGRTRVMAAHSGFLKLAELLSHWIFPLTQLAVFASVVDGVRQITLAVAVLGFGLMGIIPGVFVCERFRPNAPQPAGLFKAGFFASLREVMRNRPFRLLLAVTLLKVAVGMFANSLDYYLLVYFVQDGNLALGSIWKGVLASTSALVGLLAIYPLTQLCQRTDKRQTLKLAYALLAVGGVAKWWIFQPGHTWQLLLDPILCGPLWVATSMLLPSMLADICDQDEWKTGDRREGLFGSFLSSLQQGSTALALIISGATLNWIGFDVSKGADQSVSVIATLRFLLSGTTVLVALASIILLHFYPLSRSRVQAMSAALSQRRETTAR